eukprot:evm.model.NODE_1851_length_5616_cov_17.185007.2
MPSHPPSYLPPPHAPNLSNPPHRITPNSKKKKKSHQKKRARDKDDDGDHPTSSSSRSRKEGVEGEEGGKEAQFLQAKQGTGRITSSGQIVTGYETEFLQELRVNDALIITHPSTFIEETRIIKMIVSNSGMSLSSGFSTDLISTTGFRYLHPPEEEGEDGREAREEEGRKREKAGEEDKAFGTYGGGGGTKLVYRVKKGGTYGGYKIVTEDTGAALSRTELLERRLQHKSDRHAN